MFNMFLRYLTVGLIFVTKFAGDAYGYPTGAPSQACATAGPLHHTRSKQLIPPQPAPSPYSFKTDATEYKVGQKITVTIEGTQTFTGFMIQVRQVNGGLPVGNFSSTLPQNSQMRGCNSSNDGVTHANANTKLPGVMKFTWSTPVNVGSVEFFGTVAKDHDTFWSNITSSTVKQSAGMPSTHLKFEPSDISKLPPKDMMSKTWMWMRNNTIIANKFRRN